MNKSTTNSIAVATGDLSSLSTYEAGVAQASVHRTLQKFCDDVLKTYGISKAQWLIIGTIWDAGTTGVRITDLAARLDTGLPYITNSINLLESKNMLVRIGHDYDSRAKMITIDPDFEPKCAEIERTLREALRVSVYAHVTPEDFRVYMKVMYQLSELEM